MDRKFKFLLVSIALTLVWISSLVIDFDLQSWIPKTMTSPSVNVAINNAISNGYLSTETYSSQTSGYSTFHESTFKTRLTSSKSSKQPQSPFTSTPKVFKKSSWKSLDSTHPSTIKLFPSSLLPTQSTTVPSSSTIKANIVLTTSTTPYSTTTRFLTSSTTTKSLATSASSTTTISSASPPSTTTILSTSPHSTTTISSTSPTSTPHKKTTQHLTTLKADIKQAVDNLTYILNLPGCKMKYYKPFDEQVKPHYKKQTDLNCGSSYIFANETEIKIDKPALGKAMKLNESNITCEFFEIARKGEGKSDGQYIKTLIKEATSDVYNATQEFLEISCSKNGTIIYDDFFAFIKHKPKVDERCENITKSMKGKDKRVEKFSFVAVGLDSVSHRNFLRHFPKAYNELGTHFDVLEYNGYTKVGLNTFPCLLPLFTGKSEEELNPGKGPYDNIPFIWKNFSSLGYRTLFAEDWPSIAIFHYLKKGFYNQPTDYYLRPFFLAVEDSKMRKLGKGNCFNSRRELSVPLKWGQDFLTVFKNEPVFSFTFSSRLTHDYLNDAGYGDDPMYEFIQWFKTSNARNNSFLILFSDHGIRWGSFRKTDMGAQEDNLPFLLLLPPPSFQTKYPTFYKNLKLNQNKLVTMFDVHEMLNDILNFTGVPRDIKPTFQQRGISLFEEIPKERTCDDAGIGPEYCVCHIRKHIDVNSSAAVGAAQTLVAAINNKTITERDNCSVLDLHNVTSARQYTINKRSGQKELKTLESFKLTIYTVPGEGLFEGVVWCEQHNLSLCTIHGDIDRINKYGNQSSCINNSVMKNYCYCVHLLNNTITGKS